ncbi:Tyrosine-protein phosphatase 1 [Madurella mycetomatis]|uniref:protein-tyrosine-phosphatase n=1 Tax=Madurella mycetomatis TaxID=100816 RepID=A0A175VV29_9PEZI|nr:Tyrosine-protein phosphatase 1 [Madurella mycetomatis]
MVPPEHKINDRASYCFTMKTPPGLVVPLLQTDNLPNVFSASAVLGRSALPPKLSPGTARGAAHDTRPPSPNYFGLTVDHTADPRDSSLLPRENWSSPSSSVKSFAAAIPKQLPLDANPEFEAFRRQVDAHRGRSGFSLSASYFNLAAGASQTSSASTPFALQRPRPPRFHAQASEGPDALLPRPSRLSAGSYRPGEMPGSKADADVDSLQEDSAYVSADSKRSSGVSLNPPASLSMGTHEAPPQPQSPLPALEREGIDLAITQADAGRRSRQSPARSMTESLSEPLKRTGAATMPGPENPGTGSPAMISPAELKDLLEEDEGGSVLLLDLRISPQFAQARVRGALNLCIPTTLLKRATFNLQKLQQIFQADRDQERFSNWREAKHLVAYDASSSDKRDAVSALNMLKKFTNEGYSGSASILRGGFNAFAMTFPDLIDRSSGTSSPSLSLGAGSAQGGLQPNVPPVIGGVLLPSAADNLNPFFSNIRQNQDLVDGVGQMEIGVPSNLNQEKLPCWLREAADASDHGKRVSDKFLHIELMEQSRMREAYSAFKSPGVARTTQEEARVQLSGIEKGGKNRYKDILPFEHARVRLLGRPDGTCDYVNASHIQANRSHKRYIASQGPLPATFEDFWSVVWDHDVRVIVMLTAESEGGQLKCHPYWKGKDFGSIRLRVLSEKKVSLDIDKRPSQKSGSGGVDGSSMNSTQSPPSGACLPEGLRRRANTTTAFESSTQGTAQFNFNSQAAGAAEPPHVVIRKFALSHAAHPFSPIREITQLHYPSWPDFGTPAQPSHLLALVELANVMQRAALPIDVPGTLASVTASQHNGDTGTGSGSTAASGHRGFDMGAESMPLSWYDMPESSERARPMLVHCSAGCGRTGAFCTVDSVIDMLKRQRQHTLNRHGKGPENRAQGSVLKTGGLAGGATQRPSSDCDSDGDVAMNDRPNGTTARHDEHVQRDGHAGIDVNWLDDDSIDLIAQTVEDFRGQRLSMVQSLRQFVLCYETILEWIHRIQESSGGGGLDPRGRNRSGSLAF